MTITTGVWRRAGTSASVFAKINGTESSTKDVNVTGNAPPGRKLLQEAALIGSSYTLIVCSELCLRLKCGMKIVERVLPGSLIKFVLLKAVQGKSGISSIIIDWLFTNVMERLLRLFCPMIMVSTAQGLKVCFTQWFQQTRPITASGPPSLPEHHAISSHTFSVPLAAFLFCIWQWYVTPSFIW